MPYALCPMPYARRVPHVTEKGYTFYGQCKLWVSEIVCNAVGCG
ncbi:hypothetical protein [Microcoleus sp.]